MKNLFNNVRREAGVMDVAAVQTTGGTTGEVAKVEARQPTEQDAKRLGIIWHSLRGLKRDFTAAQKAYLANLGPKSYFADAEKVAAANEKFAQAATAYGEGLIEYRQELADMPPGVTPKGWAFPGVDAVTAIIADCYGLVGTNADRVLRGKDVSAVLKAVYPSA